MTRTWAESDIAKVGKKAGYNALMESGRQLVIEAFKAEHARAVRVVKKARRDYAIPHLSPKILDVGNEWVRDAVSAAYEQACADILAALQQGRTKEGRNK